MKKILTLTLLSTLALSASAQQYTLTVRAAEGTDKVYLRNLQAATADSTELRADGVFAFSGDAEGRLFANVYTKEGVGMPVVLSGNVAIDLTTLTATGTAEAEGLTLWNKRLDAHTEGIRALQQEYMSFRQSGQAIPDSTEARIEREYERLMGLVTADVKQCCAENSDALFPAYLLATLGSSMDKADVVAIAEREPAFMKVSLLDRMRGNIEGWKRQTVGTLFTDLAMPDSTGTLHKLSEFVGNGKYVFIDFWASWCGPCRAEMPHVKAAYEKYHAKGFDVVGLSFDNDRKAWTGAIRTMGLPWHHLSDLKGWQSVAGSTYGINSIPATLLVGPDGRIVASDLRGEALEAKLAEIFE